MSVTEDMKLKPNCNSDKAWVWTVAADFADNTVSAETLAIRFANAESKSDSLFLKKMVVFNQHNYQNNTLEMKKDKLHRKGLHQHCSHQRVEFYVDFLVENWLSKLWYCYVPKLKGSHFLKTKQDKKIIRCTSFDVWPFLLMRFSKVSSRPIPFSEWPNTVCNQSVLHWAELPFCDSSYLILPHASPVDRFTNSSSENKTNLPCQGFNLCAQ